MSQVSFPLSGDVSQVINPWNWMLQNSQLGLVNINLGLSMDPALERRILDGVGSYGRQIGRISEVLEVLLARADLLARDDLSHAERATIHDFLCQIEKVKALKQARTTTPSEAA